VAILETTLKRFIGLSTDTKPTLAAQDVGSTFYETDTGELHLWNGTSWVESSPSWVNNDMNAGVMITHLWEEVYNGHHYFISKGDSINNTDTAEIGITTPSSGHVVINFSISTSGGATAELFEGSTFTGGTTLTPINTNRGSTNTSALGVVYNPSISSDGTSIGTQQWGTSYRARMSGGDSSQSEGIILVADTKYLFRLTSTVDNNKITLYLDWHEHAQ